MALALAIIVPFAVATAAWLRVADVLHIASQPCSRHLAGEAQR